MRLPRAMVLRLAAKQKVLHKVGRPQPDVGSTCPSEFRFRPP